MTEDEVVSTIGAPRSRGPNYFGDLCLSYYEPGLDISVGFDKTSHLTTHLGFGRLSSIFYRDLDLFGDPDAWKQLVRLSSDYFEHVGFIMLCDVGIYLSGFHDNDTSQLAVCVLPKGGFEKDRARGKPFILP